MAVSEKYPDLKSNANFLALQSQLEGTENRIAIARRDYKRCLQEVADIVLDRELTPPTPPRVRVLD